jgi:hypothetical protein
MNQLNDGKRFLLFTDLNTSLIPSVAIVSRQNDSNPIAPFLVKKHMTNTDPSMGG